MTTIFKILCQIFVVLTYISRKNLGSFPISESGRKLFCGAGVVRHIADKVCRE